MNNTYSMQQNTEMKNNNIYSLDKWVKIYEWQNMIDMKNICIQLTNMFD